MGNFSRRFKSMFSSQRKVWLPFATSIGAEYADNGLFKAPLNKDLEQLKSLFRLVETLRNQFDSEL
jgi:hypothetical protein